MDSRGKRPKKGTQSILPCEMILEGGSDQSTFLVQYVESRVSVRREFTSPPKVRFSPVSTTVSVQSLCLLFSLTAHA